MLYVENLPAVAKRARAEGDSVEACAHLDALYAARIYHVMCRVMALEMI